MYPLVLDDRVRSSLNSIGEFSGSLYVFLSTISGSRATSQEEKMPSSQNNRGKELKDKKRIPYTAPAIVYEGQIEARAGSPDADPTGNNKSGAGIDPGDLFGPSDN